MGFFRVADLCVPLIALGHFFGRLGCFTAGCCYGKPTAGALGVRFPPGSVAHLELVRDRAIAITAAGTPPLHPTQLYEALAELVICGGLLLWGARKRYHGQLLVIYLVAYPVVRAAIELFRADPDRGYLVRLATPALNELLGLPAGAASLISTSQVIAAGCVVAAVLLSRLLRRPLREERS
jgi:phosphatidylglycerol:prolipoprotein diacylglycerol transferase